MFSPGRRLCQILPIPRSKSASNTLMAFHLYITFVCFMLPYGTFMPKPIWRCTPYTSALLISIPYPWLVPPNCGPWSLNPKQKSTGLEKWHHTSDDNQCLTKEEKDDDSKHQKSIEVEIEAPKNHSPPLEWFVKKDNYNVGGFSYTCLKQEHRLSQLVLSPINSGFRVYTWKQYETLSLDTELCVTMWKILLNLFILHNPICEIRRVVGQENF